MVAKGIPKESATYLFVLTAAHLVLFADSYKDQTTNRPNTLSDNADDIQRQLDNEARDRIKYGQPQTVWVFHIPTQVSNQQDYLNVEYSTPEHKPVFPRRVRQCSCPEGHCSCYQCTSTEEAASKLFWSYKDQLKWHENFTECGGRSQSPVDLPVDGLIKARGARPLVFCNYDAKPKGLYLQNDGARMTVSGVWQRAHWPLVSGGAAHSRRYLFHSLTIHWPSEHSVSTLMFPLEVQALHVSADYASLEQAIKAAHSDPQALLGIVTIYQYAKETHPGLKRILKAAGACSAVNGNNCTLGVPLNVLTPPLSEYACYQGSLPYPPCTETVLWLIRSRTLGVTRKDSEIAQRIFRGERSGIRLHGRQTQPLNDRKIYMFH